MAYKRETSRQDSKEPKHSESKATKHDADENDELTATEKLQQELDDLVDKLAEKRTETRVKALKSLEAKFSLNILTEYLATRAETVVDAIVKKCLSTVQERTIAPRLLAIVITQAEEGHGTLFNNVFDKLRALVSDSTVDTESRTASTEGLGILTFLFGDPQDHCATLLSALGSIFGQPESHILLAQVVRTWALLLTTVSQAIVKEQQKLVPLLTEHLRTTNIELVEAIGEAIVVLRDVDPSFELEDDTLATIQELAEEHNHRKAKGDLKEQRQSFRSVVKALEGADFGQEKFVVVGEKVVLESWSEHHQMEAFRALLLGGLDTQLHGNHLIRNVFGLSDVPAARRHRKPADKAAKKLELQQNIRSRGYVRSTSREQKESKFATCFNDEDDIE